MFSESRVKHSSVLALILEAIQDKKKKIKIKKKKYIYIYTHTHAGFNLRSSWSAQFSQRAVIKTLAMVGFLASLLYRTVS